MLKLVTILLCFTTATLAAVPRGKLPLAGQRNLMQFMVQTRDASQENPARSMDCFNYYIPILNGITAEYEQNYGACLKTADEAFDKIDEQTQPQRDEIESDAKDACAALARCAGYEGSIDYFSCFNTEGSYNSKTMYNISANSGEILITVREAYRLVETEQFRCTNASERAYVENTANTYEEMQSCLQGKAPVPSPSSTEPPTTWSSTTEPPTTSSSSTEPPTTTPYPSTWEQTTAPTEAPGTTIVPENENADEASNPSGRALKNARWQSILSKFKSHFN